MSSVSPKTLLLILVCCFRTNWSTEGAKPRDVNQMDAKNSMVTTEQSFLTPRDEDGQSYSYISWWSKVYLLQWIIISFVFLNIRRIFIERQSALIEILKQKQRQRQVLADKFHGMIKMIEGGYQGQQNQKKNRCVGIRKQRMQIRKKFRKLRKRWIPPLSFRVSLTDARGVNEPAKMDENPLPNTQDMENEIQADSGNKTLYARPHFIEALDFRPITESRNDKSRVSASSAECWSPSKLRSGDSSLHARCLDVTAPNQAIFGHKVNLQQQCHDLQPKHLLERIEEFSANKERELVDKMRKAQVEVSSQLDKIKAGFQLPDENQKFSECELYACPELQYRKAQLQKIKSHIKVMKKETRKRELNCKSLREISPKNEQKINKDQEMEIYLARERFDYDRYYAVQNKIIKNIKSAMDIHWDIASKVLKESDLKQPETDQVPCFECASGGHKLYTIDGLDNIPSSSEDVFLNKQSGFDISCPLVALVNSWFDRLEVEKCARNCEKVTKLNELLKHVMKDFFNKRYLNRGQLMSHTYNTVTCD